MDQNFNKNIAVISDLHIGESARSNDLNPHSPSIDLKIDEKYLDIFQRFVNRENLKADYLLISGDISNKASADEFHHASDCIKTIADSLGVLHEHIVFVPGNHDVDWSVLTNKGNDKSGFKTSQRYEALKFGDTIFTKAMSSCEGDLLNAPYIAHWNFEDLEVIGYNSAWHDDPSKKDHYGYIDQTHIDKLSRDLSSGDKSQQKLRIFLVHHHPISYSNPVPGETDFSAMQNSDNLLKLLRSNKFDILIHGHKHFPNFRASIENSGFPLAILGAGSFSAKLTNDYFPNISNQFHLINVTKRSGNSECIQGALKSWGYLIGHGWEPSDKKANGIEHHHPFGSYMMPAEIKKNLLDTINKTLASDKPAIWSNIIKIHVEYKYLSINTVEEILSEIATDLGCDFFPSSKDGRKEYLIIKPDIEEL